MVIMAVDVEVIGVKWQGIHKKAPGFHKETKHAQGYRTKCEKNKKC